MNKYNVMLSVDILFIIMFLIKLKYNYIRCHRINDRCLDFMQNKSWRICSRCLFIYIGIFSFPIWFGITTQISIISLLFICLIMQIPMLVDGYTQKIKKRVSNNFLRSITGLISGVGLGILIDIALILLNN